MTERVQEFEDALSFLDAASKLLDGRDCPFDIAAHLDFAVRRLADHLSSIAEPATAPEKSNGHWLN